MKIIKKAGDTSTILQIFIQDSSSTTGAGLTGLAYNTAGLTAYYHRNTDTTATAISLVTMTVGTFTSSGFKEIDATNMPGWYQLCPPDAALAAGATSVGIHLKGATNMAPLPIEIQLVAIDLQDAVRAGMSALPNASAGANGGLPLGDASGRVDLGKVLGTASAGAAGYVGIDWAHINAPTTAQGLTGTTIATSQVIASVTGAVGSVTGAVGSVTGNVGGNVVGSVGSVINPVVITSNIKKNQALNAFPFTMTDSTNHNPVTGLTVAGQVSIDGVGFVALTNSPATEISNGDYYVNLAAADTNGNTLLLRFTAAGADDLNILVITQP